MLKRGIQIKKFLLVAVALLFAVQMNLMDVNAASSTAWNLRFTKGAPTSDNVTIWSKTVRATQDTAYMSVTSFSSDNADAMAGAYVNGVWAPVTRTASKVCTQNVKSGSNITGKMQITKTSNLIYFKSAGKFYY